MLSVITMSQEDLDTRRVNASNGNRPEEKARFKKYAATINYLNVTDIQREFLKNRWFDQVDWMSDEAAKNRKYYELLRSIVIIGSAIVPALVTFGSLTSSSINPNLQTKSLERSGGALVVGLPPGNTSGAPTLGTTAIAPSQVQSQPSISQLASPAAVDLGFIQSPSFAALILSQVVAICAAIDQFFKYGDRWRHYRRSVELLKSSGWQFFQLSGAYAAYATKGGHEAAFALFANQVEEIIRSDVEGYISQIANPKQLTSKDQDESDPD